MSRWILAGRFQSQLRRLLYVLVRKELGVCQSGVWQTIAGTPRVSTYYYNSSSFASAGSYVSIGPHNYCATAITDCSGSGAGCWFEVQPNSGADASGKVNWIALDYNDHGSNSAMMVSCLDLN